MPQQDEQPPPGTTAAGAALWSAQAGSKPRRQKQKTWTPKLAPVGETDEAAAKVHDGNDATTTSAAATAAAGTTPAVTSAQVAPATPTTELTEAVQATAASATRRNYETVMQELGALMKGPEEVGPIKATVDDPILREIVEAHAAGCGSMDASPDGSSRAFKFEAAAMKADDKGAKDLDSGDASATATAAGEDRDAAPAAASPAGGQREEQTSLWARTAEKARSSRAAAGSVEAERHDAKRPGKGPSCPAHEPKTQNQELEDNEDAEFDWSEVINPAIMQIRRRFAGQHLPLSEVRKRFEEEAGSVANGCPDEFLANLQLHLVCMTSSCECGPMPLLEWCDSCNNRFAEIQYESMYGKGKGKDKGDGKTARMAKRDRRRASVAQQK